MLAEEVTLGMGTLRYGVVSRTATYWNLYVAQHTGLFAARG